MTAILAATAETLPPAMILAQITSGLIVNGVLFAALAGGVLYAVCRSSNRN